MSQLLCNICRNAINGGESTVIAASTTLEVMDETGKPFRIVLRKTIDSEDNGNIRLIAHTPCLQQALEAIGFKQTSGANIIRGNA